jgi:hypothetical protein
MKGRYLVTRSLYFAPVSDGGLVIATSMDQAILEVIGIPEEYADSPAQQITESVYRAGILIARARTGTRGGPTRITWAALVEKGIEAGVLEQQDA